LHRNGADCSPRHKDEFDFMGVDFKGRGRRADEAIRLMRAL
jgi:hypothetical protein